MCNGHDLCATVYQYLYGKILNILFYPVFTGKCPLYLRLIDDIFGIWICTEEELAYAIESLNECHHSIKLDFVVSQSDINFLDTDIYVDKNNMLKTKVFPKPTDHHDFLHRRSEHQESLKKNIPNDQLLRGRRIYTEAKDFQIYSNKLKESFQKRGYIYDDRKNHIERVNTASREAALTSSETTKHQNGICLNIQQD